MGEEFRIGKLTVHSVLRRRAASRLALPCTSSYVILLLTRACYIYDTDATSNPATSRLLKKLMEDPAELVTEPVMSTSETVDVQIRLALLKVVDVVRTLVLYLSHSV